MAGKKETNYVKNVTAYYRQELDKCSEKISSGKCVYPFNPNPEKSFNRGFTDYFLEKRKDCFNFVSPKSKGEYLGEVVEVKKDCFVIKTDKEVHAQDGLAVESDGCLVNKVILKGKAPTLTLPRGEGTCARFAKSENSLSLEERVGVRCLPVRDKSEETSPIRSLRIS